MRACVHRGKCVRVCECLWLYRVLKKKDQSKTISIWQFRKVLWPIRSQVKSSRFLSSGVCHLQRMMAETNPLLNLMTRFYAPVQHGWTNRNTLSGCTTRWTTNEKARAVHDMHASRETIDEKRTSTVNNAYEWIRSELVPMGTPLHWERKCRYSGKWWHESLHSD
jgi:hypothetical protein